MNVLSFGEILWDVYPDKAYIGGAPLNFAAHLAKHGETVFMLSSVGNDELGTAALDRIEEWGVAPDLVATIHDIPTGQCLVTLDERSVPTYNLLSDVAYDYILTDIVGDAFDVLYFGTLALRGEHNRRALQKLLDTHSYEHVFVDVNIRPPFYSKETVAFAVNHATILKISDEELATVAGLLDMSDTADYKAFAAALADRFPHLRCIIITRGGDGAYALDCAARQGFSCPCADVSVVSTVGAGDSFSASFLHKYGQGNPIPDCLAYASKIAGFVVSQYDAVPDYKAEDFA